MLIWTLWTSLGSWEFGAKTNNLELYNQGPCPTVKTFFSTLTSSSSQSDNPTSTPYLCTAKTNQSMVNPTDTSVDGTLLSNKNTGVRVNEMNIKSDFVLQQQSYPKTRPLTTCSNQTTNPITNPITAPATTLSFPLALPAKFPKTPMTTIVAHLLISPLRMARPS